MTTPTTLIENVRSADRNLAGGEVSLQGHLIANIIGKFATVTPMITVQMVSPARRIYRKWEKIRAGRNREGWPPPLRMDTGVSSKRK